MNSREEKFFRALGITSPVQPNLIFESVTGGDIDLHKAAPEMLIALIESYLMMERFANGAMMGQPIRFMAKKTIQKATNRPIEQVMKLWEESE